MKSNIYFKIFLFILLICNELIFLSYKQYTYALTTLLILLLFVIIVEAFERGLSNIMLKTLQTQLDITMEKKEIEKTSKKLASQIAPMKKKATIEETTELLNQNLQTVFERGVMIGKLYNNSEPKTKIKSRRG